MGMKKKHEPTLKARVALEAIKGEKTLAQLSSEYRINSNLISKWKKELIQRSADLFAKPGNTVSKHNEDLTDKLHETIGEITMENKWLKKKLKILE